MTINDVFVGGITHRVLVGAPASFGDHSATWVLHVSHVQARLMVTRDVLRTRDDSERAVETAGFVVLCNAIGQVVQVSVPQSGRPTLADRKRAVDAFVRQAVVAQRLRPQLQYIGQLEWESAHTHGD